MLKNYIVRKENWVKNFYILCGEYSILCGGKDSIYFHPPGPAVGKTKWNQTFFPFIFPDGTYWGTH